MPQLPCLHKNCVSHSLMHKFAKKMEHFKVSKRHVIAFLSLEGHIFQKKTFPYEQLQ